MNLPLNLPITPLLEDCQNILIAGAGGGFDVYVGLPIFYQLRELGKTVHLANYSFVDVRLAAKVSQSETLIPDVLVGTQGKMKIPYNYFPEGYLADYLNQDADEPQTVWMIQKLGVPAVLQAYHKLVEHLQIDAIILCDGGVDSLMFGDEQGGGTFLEDTISVTAVSMLGDAVKVKLLAAIGMGTEVEEQVDHYAVLTNIATLTKASAYYGSCALTPLMPAFEFYKAAARFSFEAENHEASRIQTRLIPAVWGEFDEFNWYNYPRQPQVFHSPLMGLYWFFDAVIVNQHSYVADVIKDADTFQRAMQIIMTIPGLFSRKRRKVML